MKWLDDFRDRDRAFALANQLAEEVQPDRSYHFMEFCGGHTHAIFRYGLQDLVPQTIRYLHGPGCPVCVLPASRVEMSIDLALNHEVILCTYGDVMRVPSRQNRSLITAKAAGADIRMVYSVSDCLRIARDNPAREVVFLAIGFETTTPPSAIGVLQAKQEKIDNFSILSNHLLTPSAINHILDLSSPEDGSTAPIDGFLGPAHVSAIIGSRPYQAIADEHQRPVVVAGFEPLDILQSTLMLVRQINEGRVAVENQYARVVTETGNIQAQNLVNKVFERRSSFEWRGLGAIARSGLCLRDDYASFDAERRFDLREHKINDVKGCKCPNILRGEMKPTDCKLFGTVCTPDNPRGACMVSSEGACAAYWSYGRHMAAA